MKKGLSKDQKRKKKLAKRKQGQDSFSYSYTGNKYRTDRLTPLMSTIEYYICTWDDQASAPMDADDTIAKAYRKLIRLFSAKKELEFYLENGESGPENANLVKMLLSSIQTMVEKGGFSREEVIGVLRTLHGSCEFWTGETFTGRGYIDFLIQNSNLITDFSAEYDDEDDEEIEIDPSELPVTALAWYEEVDWTQLKHNAQDPEEMHDTYDDWLQDANDLRSDLVEEGRYFQIVPILYHELHEWCIAEGRELVAGVASEFASVKVMELLVIEESSEEFAKIIKMEDSPSP